MPTSERFAILKNGVDERLEIIRDNETEFYNITKTTKMINGLRESEATEYQTPGENEPKTHNNEPAGIPAGSNKYKKSRDWFVNSATQILINECLRQTGRKEVYYKLDKGTDNNFKGTYVHKLLFDHFLAWLDPRYAIKISIILDNIHQDVNRKLLQEKDQLLSQSKSTIERLEQKMDEMVVINKQQTAKIDHQSSEINKLMIYTKDTNEMVRDLRERFEAMFEFSMVFARMTLPMWSGSSVFKTEFDHLLQGQNIDYALKHLKVMFIIGFYTIGEEDSEMTIYFSCTNFADVNARIRTLYKRHCTPENANERATMLQVRAISLISGDINNERAKLMQRDPFPDDIEGRFNSVRKCYVATLPTTEPIEINHTFNTITHELRSERYQSYQIRRDNGDHEIATEIIDHMVESDNQFFEDILPYCQAYFNCYQYEDHHGYHHQVASRKTRRRSELNASLTDSMYSLYKIHLVLEEDRGSRTVDDMIEANIINPDNAKALLRAGRHIVEVEDIDIPAETLQRAIEFDTSDDE